MSFGGGNWWQKTKYFAKLKAGNGLEKSGVKLPPPPPSTPQTRKSEDLEVETHGYEDARLVRIED